MVPEVITFVVPSDNVTNDAGVYHFRYELQILNANGTHAWKLVFLYSYILRLQGCGTKAHG